MGEISAADIAETIRTALAEKYGAQARQVGSGPVGAFARVEVRLSDGAEFSIQIEEH